MSAFGHSLAATGANRMSVGKYSDKYIFYPGSFVYATGFASGKQGVDKMNSIVLTEIDCLSIFLSLGYHNHKAYGNY